MKKVYLIFLLCFASVAALQAQFYTVPTCSTTGTTTYGPMYSTSTANATSRYAYIYPSTQLTGISGTTISDIYFNRTTTTGSMTAGGNFKIYLAEVAQIGWGSTALDWSTAIAGATLVYDGDPSAIVGSTAGWKKFPLSPNFTYAGTGNLAVFTEYTNPLASTSISWSYEYGSPCVNTTNSNTTKYLYNTTGTLPTSLTTTNYRRPSIGFDLLLTCYPPTGVSISNTTTTSADLSFTAPVAAPSGGYQYYLSTSSTAPTSGTAPTGTIAAGSTSTTLTGLSGGQAYYIYVRSDCGGGDISPWTGVTTFYVIPSNDDCINAISLTQGATCVTTAGSTAGATLSMAAAPCFGNPDDDVWFSFVATTIDAQVSLSNVVAVTGTSIDVYFQVLEGSCGALTSKLCSDPNTGIVGGLTVGQTYYIRVYTYFATSTVNFDICVTELTAAPTVCPTLTSPATGATTSTQPKLSWGTNSTNASGYNIYLDQNNPPTTIYATVYSTTSYTVDPALSSGVYYWYVEPFNSLGTVSGCASNTRTFTALAPPANDECTSATTLTPSASATCGTPTPGTTSGATPSSETAPTCSATGTNDDVWYSFVATSTSHTVTVNNQTTTTAAAIYSGTCGALVNVTCGSSFTTAVTIANGLTIGTTYYVRVYTTSTVTTTFTAFDICVTTTPPPPANDDCNSATVLTANSTAACASPTAGTTTSATASTETAPTCSATGTNDDVWYSFVATSTTHTVTLTNQTTTTAAAIYSGTCGALTNITCGSSSTTAIVTATGLTVGNTYYVRVYTTSTVVTTSTDFNICVTTPPANDECAGAFNMPITTYGAPCNYTTVNTTGATLSTTTGQLNSCTSTGIDDDIFFTFTTTVAGNYTFSYQNLVAVTGTAATVGMNAYTGSCGALTAVTSACSSGFGTGGSGSYSVSLAASTTYTLRLYVGSSTNSGTFDFCITTPPPPPGNDDCAGAISLTQNATCTPTSGTTFGATQSMAASPCFGTPDDDVWFSFVATGTTAEINISNAVAVTGTSVDMYFQVLSGTCAGLTSILCSDPNSNLATGLTIGNTYYIRVYTYFATSTASFDICVNNPPAPPANDDCGAALNLPVVASNLCTSPTSGTTLGATPSTETAPTCAATGTNDDVWYSFMATGTTHAVVLSNTTTTTGAAIYSGTCGSLVLLGCTSTSTTFATATGLTPGSVYYVRVYSTSSTYSTYSNFDICIVSTPANDDCLGALALNVSNTNSCSAATPGSTVAATASTETAPTCSATGTNDDVWYSFVATSTDHTVSLSNTNTTTAAAVYSGSCGSLVLVSCASTNLVVTGLTVNDTYYVRVYSTSATANLNSTFDICIGVKPINDECNTAENLIAASTNTCNPTPGSTVGATMSTQTAPTCSGTGINDDVWYSFIATATSHTVFLSNASTTTAAAVYSGTCGTLTEIGCASTTASVTGLTIGNTYYVRVYSTSTLATTYSTFDICILGPAANDDCNNATVLNSNVAVSSSTVGATQSMAPEACGATATTATDVFFQFNAQDVTATIAITNVVSFDPVVQVYSGSCGALTNIGCADANATGSGETVTLTGLTIGQTYIVRVYGYFVAQGTFNITLLGPAVPVGIQYFSGAKQNDVNKFQWKVSCSGSSTATMTLERSSTGRDFEAVETITATYVRCLQPFAYTDVNPKAGVNYYRLKTVDDNGRISYSPIVVIINTKAGFEIVDIRPNPVRTQAILYVASASTTSLQTVITDVAGRAIQRNTFSIVPGDNHIPVNVSRLSAGLYYITSYTPTGERKTVTFVKE